MWMLVIGACLWIGDDAHRERMASHVLGDGDEADVDSDSDADADGDADTDLGGDDADGDGFSVDDGDCDDTDDTVNPAAQEICRDGIDNDCDGGPNDCVPTSGRLADAIKYTGEAGDGAGASVAGAGDFDADGYDDLLIGAWTNSDGASGAGAAYVVLGSSNSGSASLSTALQYSGSTAGDQAGQFVAGAGDVNADGYDDLLVASMFNSDGGTLVGTTYLLLGSESPTPGPLADAVRFTGEPGTQYTGSSVAGAGDVDGDGYSDMAIGARNCCSQAGYAYRGAAYLLLGNGAPQSTDLTTAVKYTGDVESAFAGATVAGAGDVDADGLDDILLGSEGPVSVREVAFLVIGSAEPASSSVSSTVGFSAEDWNDYATWAVSGAGDVDSDGYADMLIGGIDNGGGGGSAGAAYLVLGRAVPMTDSLSNAVEYTGEAPFDSAGISVSAAGDIDQDGYADMLVGAAYNDDGADSAGATYLVFGGTGLASTGLSTAIEYTGEEASDIAGASVAGAGDANADGLPDLLIGARNNSEAGGSAGAAYLVLGTGI